MAYVTKICEGCEREFELTPGKNGRIHHAKRFCTRKCWLNLYNREEPTHGLKGARATGAFNAATLRGTSKGGNSYVKENGRHQHRVVAERLLRRALLPGEIVHHEDRNRKNNDPRNLIVFASQSDHVYHHSYHLTGLEICNCNCVRLAALTGGDAL